jgi:hypothetical protein
VPEGKTAISVVGEVVGLVHNGGFEPTIRLCDPSHPLAVAKPFLTGNLDRADRLEGTKIGAHGCLTASKFQL